jgi:hypothetical protein
MEHEASMGTKEFSYKENVMKTVEFIRKGLERSKRATMALLDDMKDQPLTFPTPKGGNHPLWVLGHLAYSEGEIIQQTMLGRPNPLARWKDLFRMGTEPRRTRVGTPPTGKSEKPSKAFAPRR